jgi:predicted metal-dependent HD superfamily phosphohydrolase
MTYDFLDLLQEIAPKSYCKIQGCIYNNLRQLYNMPRRAYHNWSHVEACIDELDQMDGLKMFFLELRTALYYHDCIYDPTITYNERLSAERAVVDLIALQVNENFIRHVYKLILATTHKPQDLDEQVHIDWTMVDIDLAILGKSKEEFVRYEKGIRAEYSFVDNVTFKRERKKILQGFLERVHIYHTVYFRKLYEKRARRNLERSIKSL